MAVGVSVRIGLYVPVMVPGDSVAVAVLLSAGDGVAVGVDEPVAVPDAEGRVRVGEQLGVLREGEQLRLPPDTLGLGLGLLDVVRVALRGRAPLTEADGVHDRVRVLEGDMLRDGVGLRDGLHAEPERVAVRVGLRVLEAWQLGDAVAEGDLDRFVGMRETETERLMLLVHEREEGVPVRLTVTVLLDVGTRVCVSDRVRWALRLGVGDNEADGVEGVMLTVKLSDDVGRLIVGEGVPETVRPGLRVVDRVEVAVSAFVMDELHERLARGDAVGLSDGAVCVCVGVRVGGVAVGDNILVTVRVTVGDPVLVPLWDPVDGVGENVARLQVVDGV